MCGIDFRREKKRNKCGIRSHVQKDMGVVHGESKSGVLARTVKICPNIVPGIYDSEEEIQHF